jgi:hypothetical protein
MDCCVYYHNVIFFVVLTGAIQLKNWKPLSFDVITDDKAATIDDILRELKEYTLRIRLARYG